MYGSGALLWGPSNTLIPKIVQLGTRSAPIGSQPAGMVTMGQTGYQWFAPGTLGETALNVGKFPSFHWKAELKSFPAVCDTHILLNKGISYTIGKLVNSAFECLEVHKHVTAYLLLASVVQTTDTPYLAGQQPHIPIYKFRSLQIVS